MKRKEKLMSELKENYMVFFNDAPMALLIEDFSKVKSHIDKVSCENKIDAKTYIAENESITEELASLIVVRNVNQATLALYKASSKEELLANSKNIFSPKLNKDFLNLVSQLITGRKEGEIETVNKTLEGDKFDVNIKFKVVEGSEDTLETIIVSVEDISERVYSKKKIERSEKRFREIFEKSIDAVAIIKEGRLEDCNRAMCNMFGFEDKNEVLKLRISDISPEFQPDGTNSYEAFEKMMNIVLEEGSNRFRFYHKGKYGHVFPTEVTLTKIDGNGDNATIQFVGRNITEKVKKEELENVLYNISKAALVEEDFEDFGYFVKCELHKILDTSNFFIALYDKKTRMLSIPYMSGEKEEFKEFIADETLTGQVISSKKPLLVKKDQQIELIKNNVIKLFGKLSKIWLGVPLKMHKNVFGAIVVQSYISEQAYSLQDVQLLQFVADQISTIIQRKKTDDELKLILKKAQESDRLKSAFLANMSHEIRTPMNGIIGFSELFLTPGINGTQRNKYAKVVINSSKQLLSIVNDILDISKIEAGAIKLNYEEVNINRLIDGLYAFYNPKAEKNNLSLKCKKGLENFKSVIETDRTKLNQVLTNLLSNAFKFTEKGGIEFGYEFVEEELQFYVKDSGVGIDKKLQDKIFDRFIQAKVDLNKQNKGTGLGLSISKKFVELFGGKIWIDSGKKGTSIFFTVPYVRAKTDSILSVIEEKKPTFKVKEMELTILVAEDEEYNMLYINELFSNTNFKVIEAKNGKEAVEQALNHPEISMILMDIKMPIMNGNIAMETIKKERPNLPIIALSAFAMESDKINALNNGFDAYLTKPIDRKKMFNFINKFANK